MEKPEKPRDPVARLDEIVSEITTLYAEADKLIDQYVIRLYRAEDPPLTKNLSRNPASAICNSSGCPPSRGRASLRCGAPAHLCRPTFPKRITNDISSRP